MRNIFYFVTVILFLIINQGCSESIGDDGILKVTSDDNSNNSLQTLSVNSSDISKVLTKTKWKVITTDLNKFYSSDNEANKKDYIIDMNFDEDNQVLTYADCQKLTATYRVEDKKISFYNVKYTSAIELATCIESEDADNAVYEFMLRDFEITNIKNNQLTFKSYELNTEVILSR